ncbi:TonB-dependent receptor plug domain-containing protein [Flammeovirga kamogawensis]|uniref:TonB-dependent receptor n=1 Tax=Flammeovirga kamogawensis TaxID=373891 RepID=A0ABX8GVU8_9BACT|nr:TonB-dependent receptor [Flammeovirga kamogawensis]MBB6461153.1 iron complex outermembrane receptor protein [Flammeovirga kamogawensis]QWG07719.1 TonB-dependent receptor [Flammeovirga kamogawensis]TRX69526.1 TonB-dependent receptor [Flammeovirga kamogawensis]
MKYLLVVLFSVTTFSVLGQEFKFPDRELETVEIHSQPLKYYTQGSYIQSFDSAALQLESTGSLATLLRNKASVYIREQGAPGQLSTISIRGASPENTAIMWNGINLNSLSLGQLDMSSVNIYYFDNIDVNYGSGSAQYGSGAVGGTIVLNNDFDWNKNNRYEVQTAYGSFGQVFTGFKAMYGNQKWSNKTVALYQKADNNFEFTNTSIKETTETMNNAGFWHAGVLHETHFKPNDREEWSAKIWYTAEERAIQPTMGNNNNAASYDSIESSNIRVVVDYKLKSDKWNHTFRTSYVNDKQWFYNSFIGTQRMQLEWRGETFLKDNLTLTTGANGMYIWPDVYAYPDNTNEARVSFFGALRWDITNRFNVSATLRQTIVTGYSAPFTPSFSMAYTAVDTESSNLKLKTSIARSYRVPTLNERYWGENANPNIRPEDGYNFDIGFDYTKKLGDLAFNWVSSAFYLRMYDRIQWIPADPTYAENIANSLSNGVETAIKINNNQSLSWLEWQVGSSYAFTHATDLEKDKQLIYVPRHMFKVYGSISFNKWLFGVDSNYTGWRTTTDDFDTLDPYWLLNSSVSKYIPIKKTGLLLSLKVNNLLNKEYQNYKNYPMPGINYSIMAKITF